MHGRKKRKVMGKWGLIAGGRVAVGRGWQHGRRKGEVMGKWGKEKKRKGKEKKKENGLLHWDLVWATKMEVGSEP